MSGHLHVEIQQRVSQFTDRPDDARMLAAKDVARKEGHVMARILESAWVLLYSISVAALMVWWAQVPV